MYSQNICSPMRQWGLAQPEHTQLVPGFGRRQTWKYNERARQQTRTDGFIYFQIYLYFPHYCVLHCIDTQNEDSDTHVLFGVRSFPSVGCALAPNKSQLQVFLLNMNSFGTENVVMSHILPGLWFKVLWAHVYISSCSCYLDVLCMYSQHLRVFCAYLYIHSC